MADTSSAGNTLMSRTGLGSAVALSERRGDQPAAGVQVGGEASYPGDKIVMFWDYMLGRSHS